MSNQQIFTYTFQRLAAEGMRHLRYTIAQPRTSPADSVLLSQLTLG